VWSSAITSFTPRETPVGEAAEDLGPEGFSLGRAGGDAKYLALAVLVHGDGHDHGRLMILPPARTLMQVASSQGQGHAPSSGRERKAVTRTSISAQSRLTALLDVPPAPMALTRSSTARVETPWTQASRITATSAFSAVRRGSRKLGK
jgi:hypothetical protein